jgi:hypothetical protein
MQATDAIGCVIHRVPAAFEEFAHHFRYLAIVFDQQDQPGLLVVYGHIVVLARSDFTNVKI